MVTVIFTAPFTLGVRMMFLLCPADFGSIFILQELLKESETVLTKDPSCP